MAQEADKGPGKSSGGRASAPSGGTPLRELAGTGETGGGIISSMREWIDALIIAFVLAMFIRTFVVELFKIPSGSMSPTLLGDYIAEGPAQDDTGQTRQYLFVMPGSAQTAAITVGEIQVFSKDASGEYHYEGKSHHSQLSMSQQLLISEKIHREEHRIFVNKMAYWFQPPDRGDIAVFKVPFELEPSVHRRADGVETGVHPYNRNTSVYVKRTVALPGETVEIRPGDQRLHVNGKPVVDPPVFKHRQYRPPGMPGEPYLDKVPEGEVFMFGDNSDNSLDSRYWGGVPLENFRGKAFLRYWPLRKFKFLS